MAAIQAARGIQRWRPRRERTAPLLQPVLLGVFVLGARGLNVAPAHSVPLLSTTSSSVAGVESVLWNVSLPDEPLTPRVFVDTCASLGMLPFCAGAGRDCRFVDGLCSTLAIERGSCEQPMAGIAQQLGYPGADVPAFSNMCAYRGEGHGWEDGACGGSAAGAVHGNSVEGPRFTLCAASPSSTKLLMDKLKKLSSVQWSLKLERDSVQNLTSLLEAADEALRQERGAAAQRDATIQELGGQLEASRADLQNARSRGDGGGDGGDPLQSPLGVQVRNLTGLLQDSLSEVQQERDHNQHLEKLVKTLAGQLQQAEEAVAVEKERQSRQDGAQAAGELEAARAELQRERDRAAEMQVEIDQLAGLLAEAGKKAAELEREQRDRGDVCAGQLRESLGRVEQLTGSLQDAQSDARQAREQNLHLEGSVENLTRELRSAEAALESERQGRGGEPQSFDGVPPLAGELDGLRAELQDVRDRGAQAQEEVARLTELLARGDDRAHAGEQRHRELDVQVRNLTGLLRDAGSELQQERDRNSHLEGMVGRLTTEMRGLGAAPEAGDAPVAPGAQGACAEVLEQAQAEARDLSQLLEKAKADAALEHEQASELRASLDSVTREALANASSQASSAAARASSLAQDLQAAHAELEGERGKARGLQEQLDASQLTLQQASDQALVKHDQLKSAQAALQRERARVVQMDAELKGAQAQLAESGTCQLSQGSLRAELDNCTSNMQAVQVAVHVERELSRKMDRELEATKVALQKDKAASSKKHRQIFNLTLQLQECQKSRNLERAQSLSSHEDGLRALQREHDQSLMKDIAILDLISQLNQTTQGGDQAQQNLTGQPFQLARGWGGDPDDILPNNFTALALLASSVASGRQASSDQTIRICLSPANVAAIVSVALGLVGAGFGSLIAFVLLWVRSSRTQRTPVAVAEEEQRQELDGEEVTPLGFSNGEDESFAYSVSAEPPDPTAVRIISVQCPGVTHQDVEGDTIFNGIELRISRKPSRLFTEFSWSRRFRFASAKGTFEFKKEEACLENGVLTLVFRRHTPEGISFCFPPHFDLAQDEDSDESAAAEGEVDSTADSESILNPAEASESHTPPGGSPKPSPARSPKPRSTSEAASERSADKPPKASPDPPGVSEVVSKMGDEAKAAVPPGPGKVKQLRALFSGGMG